MDGWRGNVPSAFLFSIKASRFLTHMKKLRDPAAPLDSFFRRARELETQLGPVLYQLPPQFHKHSDVLKRFLAKTVRRPIRRGIRFGPSPAMGLVACK